MADKQVDQAAPGGTWITPEQELVRTINLATALAAAQGEMPRIPKNKKANYGTYADLDTIHEKVLPVLSKHGLAWTTLPGEDEAGNDVLFYKLLHGISGEVLEGRVRLRLVQDNMQQFGSAITYARRYTIAAVTGATTDEDDDGNITTGRGITGDGEQKTAEPKKIKAPDPTEEAVTPDAINIADEEPITDKALLELTNCAKLKGFPKLTDQKAIVRAMASMYDVDNPVDLTQAQGRQVYVKIRDTSPTDLQLLIGD